MQTQPIQNKGKAASDKSQFKVKDQNPEAEHSQEPSLCSYQQAHQFIRVPGITHGYLRNFNTPLRILKSLFMVHYQTANVWTHLAPAICIIGFIFYFVFYISRYSVFDHLHVNNFQISQKLNTLTSQITIYAQNVTLQGIERQANRQIDLLSMSAIFTVKHLISQIKLVSTDLLEVATKKVRTIEQQVVEQLKTSIAQLFSLQQKLFKNFYIVNENKTMNMDPLLEFSNQMLQVKHQIIQNSNQLVKHVESLQNLHVVAKWPIIVFLLCQFVCLMFSSIFHAFGPMSARHYPFFLRMDYAGISIIMAGTSFPYIYYTTFCRVELGLFYLSLTSVLGAFMFIVSLFQWTHRYQNLHLKTFMYVLYSVHYFIPIGHMVYDQLFKNNYGDEFSFIKLTPYIFGLMGSDFIGAIIYATKWPEKWSPGKYNLCWHSHMIWHIFIDIGIIFAYFGALEAFQMRKNCACPL